MLIAYIIVSGVLLYNVGVMSDYHNNFSMRDNILFFCITTIISYIFFVECKFKARISAYSLYHTVLCDVGVMSDSHKNFSMHKLIF